jgi:hypothetical protein
VTNVTKTSATAVAALLFTNLIGCTQTCPRESEDSPRRYTDGTTSAGRTFYETNDWKAPFLDFPAGRRLALVHGLRDVPVELQSYLAFDERPFPSSGEGFVAESAGNQVLIEDVNEEFIRVRNDTCENFFLRLVASTAPPSDGSSGGAGGSP